jgi:glycosyl transferase family 25
VKAFVISLAESGARRDFMARQLERLGLDFEFFDGVRGSERVGERASYDREGALRREGRELRAGEIGAALSHGAVYAEIDRRALPWALVLEDDAELSPDLPAVIGALEDGVLEQGDVVLLERCDRVAPLSVRNLVGRYRIARPVLLRAGAAAQAAGYVVTLAAAAAMKGVNLPVTFPADSWGYYRELVRFRGILPSRALVRQVLEFGSYTLGRERRAFGRSSLLGLLAHDFLTYTRVGRSMLPIAKRIAGR